MGNRNPGLQIVRHHQRRNAAQILERVDMGHDPFRQTLRPTRFDIRVVARSEHRNEYLRLAHLTRLPILHGHRLAAIVHEELLAGFVFLAHRQIQRFPPGPVPYTELRVLEPVRMDCLVLFPDQAQRDAFAGELPMDFHPVRHDVEADL